MIRRSIKAETYTHAITEMDFRVNITSSQLLLFKATDTHYTIWMTAVNNESLLVVYNHAALC